MKVQDESDWQQLVSDLLADGETGTAFLDFVETWCETAEDVLLNWPDKSAMEAIRLSLDPAENRHGIIDSWMMGQMLCVILQHWKRGKEVAADLSPIEMKLVRDCLNVKIWQLQQSAKDAGKPAP
jgi:hypothetical protein